MTGETRHAGCAASARTVPIWGDDGQTPTGGTCACCGCTFGRGGPRAGGDPRAPRALARRRRRMGRRVAHAGGVAARGSTRAIASVPLPRLAGSSPRRRTFAGSVSTFAGHRRARRRIPSSGVRRHRRRAVGGELSARDREQGRSSPRPASHGSRDRDRRRDGVRRRARRSFARTNVSWRRGVRSSSTSPNGTPSSSATVSGSSARGPRGVRWKTSRISGGRDEKDVRLDGSGSADRRSICRASRGIAFEVDVATGEVVSFLPRSPL